MITPDKTELWRDDIVLFRVKNKNTTHYKARPRGSKIVEKVRIPKNNISDYGVNM